MALKTCHAQVSLANIFNWDFVVNAPQCRITTVSLCFAGLLHYGSWTSRRGESQVALILVILIRNVVSIWGPFQSLFKAGFGCNLSHIRHIPGISATCWAGPTRDELDLRAESRRMVGCTALWKRFWKMASMYVCFLKQQLMKHDWLVVSNIF
jgi:hypothetical protein